MPGGLRLTIGLMLLGPILLAAGFHHARVRSRADTAPEALTCAELATSGPGSLWIPVWAAGNTDADPNDLAIVFHYSDAAWAARHEPLHVAASVQGLILNDIRPLAEHQRDLLRRNLGTIDLDRLWVLGVDGIRPRNPYIDPLHEIQQLCLPEWRESEEGPGRETLTRLLALTAHGIAFGMKSTG